MKKQMILLLTTMAFLANCDDPTKNMNAPIPVSTDFVIGQKSKYVFFLAYDYRSGDNFAFESIQLPQVG